MDVPYFEESCAPPPFVVRELYRKETRVSSALTIGELESLVLRDECVDDLRLWIGSLHIPDLLDSAKNYQKFFFSILWTCVPGNKSIPRDIIQIMNQLIRVSTVDWANVDYQINYETLNANYFLRRIYSIRLLIDDCVNFFKCSSDSRLAYTIPVVNIHVKSFKNYLHFEHNSRSIVIPWMCFLAVQDAFIGLFDVALHAIINDFLHRTKFCNILFKFIEACISSVCSLGKEVYSVLKSIHPLNIGRILDSEHEGYENELFATVFAELPECALKEYYRVPLDDRMDKMVGIQLGGVVKCFTYPIVEIETSIQNVRDKAERAFKCDLDASVGALNMFKKIFIREWIRVHRVWPPCEFVGRVPGHIREAYNEGRWNEVGGNWHPDDFNYVEIGHCLDFDYGVDPTEALADKSIASGLSSWPREYDTRYHYIKYKRGCKPGPPCEKRVIIEHLKRRVVNTRDSIISTLRAPLHTNNKMFVMCLKERELSSSKGRYFTKLTFDTRLYQTAVEHNMIQVLRYFPHQSMTMSGNALAKHMISSSSKLRRMKISTDFTKWCLHQSHALSVKYLRQLDQMCNTPGLFESAHIIAETSYCFFQDHSNIPEQWPNGLPKVGTRCIFGLNSLGEGMFQKIWTTITSCGILYYTYDIGCKIDLTASGDNQLLLVTIPRDEDPVVLQARVLTCLNTMSVNMGLPLKMEETFTSEHLLEYGKNCFLDGKKIGMAWKKASRIGTDSMEVLPSLNTKLSGIYSTGVATAGEDSCPVAAFSVCMIEAAFSIKARMPKVSTHKLGSMLTISRALGGLKVTNYANFCTRGVIDHAAYNLNLLHSIVKYKDRLHLTDLYNGIMKSKIAKRCPASFKSLCKDPYAISVNTPMDSESWLKDIITQHLPGEINNIQIKPLFSTKSETQEDLLCSDLKTLEPMSLKLASTLYAASNIALRDKAAGRFASATSVNKLVTGKIDMVELYTVANEYDERLIDFYNQEGKSPLFVELLKNDCPTLSLDKLREELVGLKLSNPSMPPPQHQFQLIPWVDVPLKLSSKSVWVSVSPSIREFLLQRGQKRTYLGSDTKIKRSKSPLEVINADPMERVAVALGELSSWVGDDIYLQELITRLIQEKTITPADVVKDATREIIGGTVDHRLRIMTAPQGAYANYDPNISSHFEISTDTATDFARKADDFTIMFQSVKVNIGSQLIHKHLAEEDIVKEYGCVFACSTCTRLVYGGEYSLKKLPSYPGLRLGPEKNINFVSKGLIHGEGDPYTCGHMYIAETLAAPITHWDHYEKIMETDTIDKADLAHNADCNISELSRSNLRLLLTYLFMFIRLNENVFNDLVNISINKTQDVGDSIDMVINTLIVAGHGPALLKMAGSYLSRSLDNATERKRLFLTIFRHYRDDLMQNIEYVMPESRAELIYKMAIIKNSCMDQPLNRMDWILESYDGDYELAKDDIMQIMGLRYGLSQERCIRAIRSHASMVELRGKCQLETAIKGTINPEVGKWSPSFSVTYGLTPEASQVWSLSSELPDIPAWTIEDRQGSIGVVMGHRSNASYIVDCTRKNVRRIRINNGPEALSFDECSSSYHKDYYISSLCQPILKRPIEGALLIICPTSKGYQRVNDLIRPFDTVMVRGINIGGPAVGHPRRHEDDIWYINTSFDREVPSEMIKTPRAALSSYRANSLSPYVRARREFHVDQLKADSIKHQISEQIKEWDSIVKNDLVSGIQFIQRIKSIKTGIITRNFDDILTLKWILRAIGGNMTQMPWHRGSDGAVHTDCSDCAISENAMFIPKDILLGVYLVYLCKNAYSL